jgi:hypothetical protein
MDKMSTLFIGIALITGFAFLYLAIFLWNLTGFLKTGFFDFRFVVVIGLALLAKLVIDRIRIVFNTYTEM